MLDVNEDPEYHELKSRIKGREVAREVWGVVSAVGMLVAAFTFFSPAAAIGLSVAAATTIAAVSGVTALISGWKAFRADQDVRFDTQELEARRQAVNLSRALGQTRGAETDVATAYTMARRDGRTWADSVQQEASPSTARSA